MLISSLKQIDLLGKEATLMIDKKKRFTTFIGGILTILLVLTSVLAFIAFGRDIIDKKEPQITFWKNPSSDIKFDFSHNFTYVMTVYDPFKNAAILELEKLLRVYVVTQDIDPNKKSINKSVIEELFEMEKCPKEKLNSEINNTIFLNFDSYYCLPKNVSLPLRGTWNIAKNRVFKINIDYCKNTTLNNNSCYSIETIAKKLPSNFNFHYVMFDNYPEHTDYENPIKPTFISAVTRSNINTMTRLIYWLKNVEYFTDYGWILQTQRKEEFTSIDRIDSQIFPTPNTPTFFSHMFTISPMKENYNRSYIKVQGVAAYIGGFITFFKMILSISCEYLTRPFFLNLFYENYYSAAGNTDHDTETILKNDTLNNNILSSSKFWKKSNTTQTKKCVSQISINRGNLNLNIKNKIKPEKIKKLNVLFRCLKISDDFNNYLNYIDNLFKENISIENLCHIISRVNLLEERILKKKDLLIEDCKAPQNKMLISNINFK